MDVASAFPLNALTLGNSLRTYFNAPEDHLPTRVLFRLTAAVPPMLGAAMVSDLGSITTFVGVCGMCMTFVVPAVLHRCSAMVMKGKGAGTATLYSTPFTTPAWAWCVGAVGIFMMAFVVIAALVATA